ncbi:site-specific DNA-methyltransferase [Micromonospora saelicesensis]|uniref:site-specific DNA-methyltransferase n=1 Tax=Micromonospora saelicesensis TaxID=285676 RepID=UPI003D8B43E4
MSRLSDLLRQVEQKSPQLAADLTREVKALSERREFGLNFERHTPETVELPGRPVRKGDKVRFLAERGEAPKSVDQRLWRVLSIVRTDVERIARLVRQDGPDSEPETTTRPVSNLVVVAEFRDPIYPGLKSTGTVERGGEKPFHTVINAENFHALQALLYTHEGKVDAIYIDPPYNTRDNDWKYNNDYVDPADDYAHSKWLAFMERRLKLAKKLLNPDSSALIVTIDEKEFLRLGLLLEQIFTGATIQMVTSVISAKGAVRRGRFSRVEENIFFVTIGDAKIHPWTNNMLPSYKEGSEVEAAGREDEFTSPTPIEWIGLRRREPSSTRGSRPNQFYPIFVHREDGTVHSVGDPIDDGIDRHSVPTPNGTVPLWPLRPDGTEMLWGLTPDALRKNWKNGFVRVNWKKSTAKGTVYYLPSGTIARIRTGDITVTGRAFDGSIEGHITPDTSIATPPKRVWNMSSHNAEIGGTNILSALLPKRHFPYPKSLYAVEDALRFVVGHNREALVVDFFGGSGTTAHAVMRLNRQDGGTRRSIVITNNEVSADEQAGLREILLRPGDADWEKLGICEYITKPRLQAAVTGSTPDGTPVAAKYRFVDPFPMSQGFEDNIEFFTMTYEASRTVAHNRAFEAIAPLLWLKAGSQGRRIDKVADDYDVADTYSVLFDMDASHEFLAATGEAEGLRMAFIVTDDDRGYQMVCSELPAHVEPVRLYESYLTNFTINTGRE